jgi:hypothetical protein
VETDVEESHDGDGPPENDSTHVEPDPPLLSIVDRDTGEVVEPEPEPPPSLEEVAYAIADDEGKAQIDRANFLWRNAGLINEL